MSNASLIILVLYHKYLGKLYTFFIHFFTPKKILKKGLPRKKLTKYSEFYVTKNTKFTDFSIN